MAFKLVTPVEPLLLNLNLFTTPIKSVLFSVKINKTFVSKIKYLHTLIKIKFYYSSFILKIYPVPITHKDLEGNKKMYSKVIRIIFTSFIIKVICL